MIKKHTIGRLLTTVAAIFLITQTAASAADKAVVIPLDGGNVNNGGVRTVMSAGQAWMDRNLGAHRAATKSDDSQAYGSLYQWGRLGDGHEYRESPTTTILSTDDVPGHGHFITVGVSPYDWMATPKDSLWLGESGINNPCPAGFRLATETEWETERASWGSGNNNATGAFTSPLRLVMAGYRDRSSTVGLVGSGGLYWSSTVGNSNARSLYFGSGNANTDSNNRAYGMSVRCIKD